MGVVGSWLVLMILKNQKKKVIEIFEKKSKKF
jgi:hypothetical protein